MKIPKKIKRYCPYCKAKTEQKVSLLSTGVKRGTLTWGSLSRARKRGRARGTGNLGRWGSKPAISKWKRKTKATKRLTVIYTCDKCKKSKYRSKGIRTSKLQIE